MKDFMNMDIEINDEVVVAKKPYAYNRSSKRMMSGVVRGFKGKQHLFIYVTKAPGVEEFEGTFITVPTSDVFDYTAVIRNRIHELQYMVQNNIDPNDVVKPEGSVVVQ